MNLPKDHEFVECFRCNVTFCVGCATDKYRKIYNLFNLCEICHRSKFYQLAKRIRGEPLER